MYSPRCYVQSILFPCIHPPPLTLSLSIPSAMSLSLGRRGCDTDFPFRAENSVVSCSLHLGLLYKSFKLRSAMVRLAFRKIPVVARAEKTLEKQTIKVSGNIACH